MCIVWKNLLIEVLERCEFESNEKDNESMKNDMMFQLESVL